MDTTGNPPEEPPVSSDTEPAHVSDDTLAERLERAVEEENTEPDPAGERLERLRRDAEELTKRAQARREAGDGRDRALPKFTGPQERAERLRAGLAGVFTSMGSDVFAMPWWVFDVEGDGAGAERAEVMGEENARKGAAYVEVLRHAGLALGSLPSALRWLTQAATEDEARLGVRIGDNALYALRHSPMLLHIVCECPGPERPGCACSHPAAEEN